MEYLYILLSMSGVALGIFGAAEFGNILAPAREWCIQNLPIWISKPLILCPTCMASIWGSIVYWISTVVFLGKESITNTYILKCVLLWIAFVIMSSFINRILYFVHEKLKNY